ncbi:diguanylate cyclase [Rhodoferax sp. AJA081-3]|uniref:tetratricopeptide repeat-containing diguanylate cyclase n=1 Tax=Rhodoferax sp. AJA081-3 TaxID=2752316 RepID=UPI001ADF7915|nr:GGDEF domain-containing protein [Rhodoferax sp. AJA081-3]QTN27486.1 diguanylate cyclase [Rhodoferax sp. AJA081-3]
MARPLKPLVCLLATLLVWHGAVFGQQETLDRIDAVYGLSQRNNTEALAQIRTLGEQLSPTTPYVVQREYLITRIDLELDSGLNDAAKVSIAKLLALARAQPKPDDTGLAMGMGFEASVMVLAAQHAGAILKLDEARPFAERSGDAVALGQHYRILGTAQLSTGKFEPALESYLKSLQYADQQTRHPKQSRLRSLNGLSNVYAAMKNHEKTLVVIDEALALATELDSRKMLATLYLNQGGEFAEMGRHADYAAANAKALKISRESGLVTVEATILNNMGDAYLRSRDYPKAEQLARQALAKYREIDDRGGLITAQCNIGFALMGQGKVAQGAQEVRAALTLAREANLLADEEDILGELGRMYEQLGLHKDAVATIREQQKLSAQLFQADREKSVAALQEQFDTVQRQKQIELLARENSLKDATISNQRLQQVVTLLGVIVTVMGGVFVFLLYRRVRKTNQKLREANKQLEFHAVRDPLTGLFNRRSFFDLMNRRAGATNGGRREDDNPDGLMILDIDHFKNINDTLGHAGGDAVLIEIAKRLRSTVRDTDMVMRWGGEEFLVFSPKANAAHLKSLAQRVLNVVGQEPIAVGDKMMTITVTGGFLSLPFSGLSETDCNWEKAMQIADMALYLGKVNGRNRAYGLNRLLAPFEQVMPVLERDISAALKANMVELVEVLGPTPAG